MPASRTQLERQVDAVMDASRVVVAMVAQSLAELDSTVTLPQFRVLVLVHNYGPLRLGQVATGMGVHPSNATRICHRLVRAGLLDRREGTDDRRHQMLTLSTDGRRLLDTVTGHRREAIGHVLRRMPAAQRRQVAAVMQQFADTSGHTPEEVASALGWIH